MVMDIIDNDGYATVEIIGTIYGLSQSGYLENQDSPLWTLPFQKETRIVAPSNQIHKVYISRAQFWN